ncbi:MAG: surface antigen [Arenicella sp.]|jgi:surface antigen
MKIFTLLLMASSLAACAVSPDGRVVPDGRVFNKESTIPLGAGLLGAVVCNKLFKGHGSKDGWTAACGAAGYFASRAFVVQHDKALENNRVGQTTSWSDPDGSNHTLTPTQTYNENSRPCRDFRQTVEIDGQTEIMTGKACRQSNGSWKLIG